MGIPQMGAIVLLYNRQDRAFGKVLTDDHGEFQFLGLLPDLYSVRVTLATFVPALKKDILVQPGMRSVLNVNLNTLFSTIQLAYPSIESGSLMSDDWKWVLRSASSTRPVLRFAAEPLAEPPGNERRAARFSPTRAAWCELSAGDGALVTGVGNEADLGTAFALATSLYGSNLLQVSGNVGYGSQTGVPAAAFRTSYSRDMAAAAPRFRSPCGSCSCPARLGAALIGSGIRAAHAAHHVGRLRRPYPAHRQRHAAVWIRAGFGHVPGSSELLQPLCAAELQAGRRGEVDFAYTSGNAPARPRRRGSQDAELQRDLSTLGLFPRISLLGRRGRRSSAAKSTN